MRCCFLLSIICLLPGLLAAQPVADMHLHYKWSQREVTTPIAAIDLLKQQDIVMGVVIGTPAELALELARQAPDRVVPIYSPYQISGDWHRWAFDESVIERTRSALASGQYRGIGELHLIGGFAPKLEKAQVLPALMQLANNFDVPVLLHTEYSKPDSLLSLCKRFSETRVIWAHAGAILAPNQVARVLDACSNVHAGLAARDPWRFVNNPITDKRGQLLPEWRSFMIKYQDRLMLGSDPVWPVDQLDRWDEPDTGWQELERFWNWHRSWLEQLPESVKLKISCINAVKLFRREAQSSCVH